MADNKYTFDVDIDPVLQAGLNEELDVLIRLLKTGDYLKNIEQEQLFLRHYPDHRRYVHLISMQVRSCGGHAIANLFRGGKGPDYKTIVSDVADHLKVVYDEDDSVPVIERRILMAMTKDIYNDLGEYERKLLIDSLSAQQSQEDQDTASSSDYVVSKHSSAHSQSDASASCAASAATTAACAASDASASCDASAATTADCAASADDAAGAVRDAAGKSQALATVQSRELVVQAVEKGDYSLLSTSSLLMLSETLSQLLARVAGVAETGISTVHDGISKAASELATEISRGLDQIKRLFASVFEIGGPAYKVTVPCVTQIASMRLRQSGALLSKPNPHLLSNKVEEQEDTAEAASTAERASDSSAACSNTATASSDGSSLSGA